MHVRLAVIDMNNDNDDNLQRLRMSVCECLCVCIRPTFTMGDLHRGSIPYPVLQRRTDSSLRTAKYDGVVVTTRSACRLSGGQIE